MYKVKINKTYFLRTKYINTKLISKLLYCRHLKNGSRELKGKGSWICIDHCTIWGAQEAGWTRPAGDAAESPGVPVQSWTVLSFFSKRKSRCKPGVCWTKVWNERHYLIKQVSTAPGDVKRNQRKRQIKSDIVPFYMWLTCKVKTWQPETTLVIYNPDSASLCTTTGVTHSPGDLWQCLKTFLVVFRECY